MNCKLCKGDRRSLSAAEGCREEISLWVRKKTDNAVTTIRSEEEAEIILKKNLTTVLGYFDKLEVHLTSSIFSVYAFLIDGL